MLLMQEESKIYKRIWKIQIIHGKQFNLATVLKDQETLKPSF